MKSVRRVDILGCPFDAIPFEDVISHIQQAVLRDQYLQVVPGNVDFVMKAKRDPVFVQELWRADLVVADGVPIVWAASLLGTPICRRVSGTDLVMNCARLSAEIGCAVALIGARPGVSHRAAQTMSESYPGARLHAIPTPMVLGEVENAQLIQRIQAIDAKIVLVALGAPRQERWVQANLAASGANVGIGIGSAFDIICGDTPRAPTWLKDKGMEWCHRMLHEPKRLGKRYLIEDSPFIYHLAREVFRQRLQKTE
jgi:N-acetylglucosaminyldiphosphoundecaprenol N-acetyl-beta-D-mannosaminyltransferase